MLEFATQGVMLGYRSRRIDLISVLLGPAADDYEVSPYMGTVSVAGRQLPVQEDVREHTVLSLLGDPDERCTRLGLLLRYDVGGLEAEFEFYECGSVGIITLTGSRVASS